MASSKLQPGAEVSPTLQTDVNRGSHRDVASGSADTNPAEGQCSPASVRMGLVPGPVLTQSSPTEASVRTGNYEAEAVTSLFVPHTCTQQHGVSTLSLCPKATVTHFRRQDRERTRLPLDAKVFGRPAAGSCDILLMFIITGMGIWNRT